MLGVRHHKFLIPLLWTILIHLMYGAVFWLVTTIGQNAKEEKKKEVRIRFRVEKKIPPEMPPPKKIEPELVKKKEEKFEFTTDKQLQELPKKETIFFGEHNTLAQSNKNVVKDAPERISVKGVEQRFENAAEFFLQEDEEIEEPKDTKDLKKIVNKEVKKAIKKPNEEEILEPEPLPKIKENPVELAKELQEFKEEEVLSSISNKLVELQREIEKRKQVEVKELIKKNSAPVIQKNEETDLFKKRFVKSEPRIQTTTIDGSINRRGKFSSRDVKATPLGKYISSVMKAVSKEWIRRCSRHADLLLPGSLTIRWFVDKDGKVLDLFIVDSHYGGEVQNGITMQAIKKAKTPKMPEVVRKKLDGDLLGIQINFQF